MPSRIEMREQGRASSTRAIPLGHSLTLGEYMPGRLMWWNAEINKEPYRRWRRAWLTGYAEPEMLKARNESQRGAQALLVHLRRCLSSGTLDILEKGEAGPEGIRAKAQEAFELWMTSEREEPIAAEELAGHELTAADQEQKHRLYLEAVESYLVRKTSTKDQVTPLFTGCEREPGEHIEGYALRLAQAANDSGQSESQLLARFAVTAQTPEFLRRKGHRYRSLPRQLQSDPALRDHYSAAEENNRRRRDDGEDEDFGNVMSIARTLAEWERRAAIDKVHGPEAENARLERLIEFSADVVDESAAPRGDASRHQQPQAPDHLATDNLQILKSHCDSRYATPIDSPAGQKTQDDRDRQENR